MTLFAVLFFSLCALTVPASAQPYPDSLIARVVFLEKIAYETGSNNWNQPSYPQATGFFISFGTAGLRYLVTARHALYRPDTVAGTQIHVVGIAGRNRDYVLGDYRTSRSVLQHQDTLVDLVMIDNTSDGVGTDWEDTLPFFQPSDVVGKGELEALRRGQKVMYIGRWPDSDNPATGTYQMPQGLFLKAVREPLRLVDPEHHFAFRADFSVRIPGRAGVSGSPVLIRQENRYRLLGVISAFALDANKNMTNVAYCTAGYRILETLESRPVPPVE